MIKIHLLPILNDNYAYLLVHDENQNAAVIDPGEAAPILDFLEQHNLRLTHILNTHHHGDHIAGNADLISRHGAQLVGPAAEKDRIDGMDVLLKGGDHFDFEGIDFEIIETPGHTRGHICFYSPDLKALFAGDTLFSLGCGRLFEGTAEQMWDSFEKLMALPDDTRLYCGHEYTVGNGAFCLHIEPDNKDLQVRMSDAQALQDQGKPTLPSTLGMEKKTNVFLRAGSAERLGELRTQKDNF